MEDAVAEWVRLARRDARAARLLLEAGDPENGLYLCQQALEKALKGRIQHQSSDPPPRTHNLMHLAQVAGCWQDLSPAHQRLLADLTQLLPVTRYGGTVNARGTSGDPEEALTAFARTEEVLEWLLRGPK